MTIVEALGLCMSGHTVRPVCWRKTNIGCWLTYIDTRCLFVENGTMQEMPHALRLSTPDEFLGEWEVVELDANRNIMA